MDWHLRSTTDPPQISAAANGGDNNDDDDRQYTGPIYTMARRANKTVAWSDFARTAETGDIALFSGQGVISNLIKLAELGSNWSHVGMFVRESDGRLRVWESTNADGQMDLITGTRKGGVRLVDAETVIRGYLRSAEGAMVVARRLYIDASVLGQSGLADPVQRLPKLRAFMKAVSRLPYEQNPIELMRASELARWIQLVYAWRSQSSFFCSELVACSYIQLGLLPDDSQTTRHASLYTPMDFAQESQDLPFLYDQNTNESMVGLGPHLAIVFPDTGSDPMHTAPRLMPNPTRPQLRLSHFESYEEEEKEKEKYRSQGLVSSPAHYRGTRVANRQYHSPPCQYISKKSSYYYGD